MKRDVANFASMMLAGAMCMIAACSSEEFDGNVVEETSEECHWQRADINLCVNRTHFDSQDGSTRSVEDGWKDGDRIYLILKDKDGNDVQAYVTYDAATASWGQVEFYAYRSYITCTTPRTVEAYYFDGEIEVSSSDVTFDVTTGVYVCMDGIYTYPDNGDLEVSISLAPLTSRIRFTGEPETGISILGGMKGYTGFSRKTGRLTEELLNCDVSVVETGTTPYIYGVFTNQANPSLVVGNGGDAFKAVFPSSTNVLQVGHSGYIAIPTANSHRGWKLAEPVTGLSLDQDILVISKGNTATLHASLTPAGVNSDIAWLSSDASIVQVSETGVVTAVAVGSATITAVAYDNTGIKSTCVVTVPDANGHEYVDLGLTSGTLWATMNVGASTPEDGGYYFAWGEVTGYDHEYTDTWTNFDWSIYTYCRGSINTMTKYCTSTKYGDVDNRTELELSDDAARHHWGGSWRMPSNAQFVELYNECTWTIITNVGFRVSSKKNANSIILPLWDSNDNYGYWSRSLYENSNYAYVLSSENYVFTSDVCTRCSGRNVRPVLCPE